MKKEEAAKAIVDIGRRVYDKGFVAANDGNISCRLCDGSILITPTGVSKGFMDEECLVHMTVDGEILNGKKPSSECKMHLRVYKDNPSVCGVIHAHPIFATSFSVLGISLDCPVVAEGVLVTGNIPLAEYAEPGTFDVPESIAPFIQDYNGALLENHGAITWGSDLYQALFRMEALEHQAQILYRSIVLEKATGIPVRYFSEDDLQKLVAIRTRMGILTGGVPKGTD